MLKNIILAMFCLVTITLACQPPPCHWSDATPIENYFIQVADAMIAADRKAQAFCSSHGSPLIVEDHKPTQYKVIYPNPGGDVFEIKVRDRVMLVRAQNCEGTVADVRVLPAYVDPRGAYYTVDVDKLVITFPYKFDPVSGGGVCIPPDPATFSVPHRAGLSGTLDCDNCGGRGW